MMVCLAVLLALQAGSGPDEIRSLALQGPESTLVDRTRARPDDARTALRQLLAGAARTGDSASSALAAAERLASTFVVAWRDSFQIRQVTRFRALSSADRTTRVAADSLRLAGNEVFGRVGVDAAMRVWRESLRRFETLHDTAGMAAALGNLGAGFYQAQQLDSAELYLTRSRAYAEHAGDHRTAGNAVGTLGSVSKDRGDLRRASELYGQAGELRQRTGDSRGLAADYNNLGLIAEQLGDLAEARRAYQRALAANREAGRAAPAATNLVNLGNVASLEGSYADASTRYREALAIYRELEDQPGTAAVLHNLGLLAMRRGDYPGAVATLAEAAAIYRRTGPASEELAVRQSLANARAARGDLEGARLELLRAGRLPEAQRSAPLALAQGDLALHFNQLPEAQRHYARAERLARAADDLASRAAAHQGAAVLLLIREEYARAQAMLELALQAYQRAGDRSAAAATRLLVGFAQRERGDTAAARRTLLQSLDTLRALGDAAGEASALGALGELETRAGLPLTAESLYHRGLKLLEQRPAPAVRWTLHAGLAAALEARGALDDAAVELRAAVTELERTSATIRVEERRSAFLADKWDVYTELALIERTRGRTDAAFDASERLRARQLLDLLARGRVGATTVGGDAQNREQDLRRRITELTRQLEVPAEGTLRGPALAEAAAAREALAQAQDVYAQLLVEMREADPMYLALLRGEVAPLPRVMASVEQDAALIEYLVGDSTTVAFVITRDTAVTVDLNVTHAALAGLVDFARGTLAGPAEGAARRAWRTPMRRLFAQLIAPIAATGLLAGKRSLLIAPHAELHYVPFAALVAPATPEQLLIDRYTIEYIPSASVWLRLRERPRQPAGPRETVLALAPRPAQLPASRTEVGAIRRIYGARAQVLEGTRASERAFRTLAPDHGIVHLASYGVLNKHNPLFSFVELTPGGESDGRLEVHEVFGLSLNARLLVLSACQTGLGAGALADVPPGDDWVGLVQAFLFAGAGNVLATLWPVQDAATATLMERFYQELSAGRSESEALARAQRAAAHRAATAHPFFWAGFALVRGR